MYFNWSFSPLLTCAPSSAVVGTPSTQELTISRLECLAQHRSHGGMQGTYRHLSVVTGTPMTFSVFVPPQAERGPVPSVTFLSGLSCTHANVTEKGEYRRTCAELGLLFVAPDTSPRGDGVPDDSSDAAFGLGAGFYVDATELPYAQHYKMWSYVAHELPAVLAEHFPVDVGRQGIMGHSMGGHGALTVGLTYPGRFRAVSAFAPIVAPTQVPWGQRALRGYLGADATAWRAYDAVALIAAGARVPALRVDQGADDPFLVEGLRPHLLAAACATAGIPLALHMWPGYDHSYFFVSTFMAEQLHWQKVQLSAS